MDTALPKLTLINNNNKPFFFRLLANPSDFKKGLYIKYISANDTIKPTFILGKEGAWESFIKTYSPDTTLNIFIIDTVGIDTNRVPQQIISQRKYKKLSFKLKELDSMKWIVAIPKYDSSLHN